MCSEPLRTSVHKPSVVDINSAASDCERNSVVQSSGAKSIYRFWACAKQEAWGALRAPGCFDPGSTASMQGENLVTFPDGAQVNARNRV